LLIAREGQSHPGYGGPDMRPTHVRGFFVAPMAGAPVISPHRAIPSGGCDRQPSSRLS
jgi:hypothetical protein